jgi:hypothetical protein
VPRPPRKTKSTNQINKFQKPGVEVEYDRIRADRLWEIVRNDLPSLRTACEQALAREDQLTGKVPPLELAAPGRLRESLNTAPWHGDDIKSEAVTFTQGGLLWIGSG